jgi:ParB family protein of integrating conjugative element (PFGI_1 class)
VDDFSLCLALRWFATPRSFTASPGKKNESHWQRVKMMAQRKRSSTTAMSPREDLVATRIEVTRIQHYGRNPRRQQNPEYDRIKASIRDGGLDQPLVLTQEPGATEYVLHSGGNTRLRILKELYEETADERYYWIDCVIRPWSQESAVLLAHLRENELRGGLQFIDKAHAVFDVKSLLEAELAIETLSQRQLESLFRERGFSLSHSTISRMGYAVHILWPVMPRALSAGLGRPQIEKIRSLERAARHIWLHRQLGEESLFDNVFAELCRRYDGTEWDIHPLYCALRHEIAVESEQSEHIIHLEIEACLAGRAFDCATHPGDDSDEEHPLSVSGRQASAVEGSRSDATSRTARALRDLQANDGIEADPTEPSAHHAERIDVSTPVKRDLTSLDIPDLRSHLYATAARLAAHHGLGGCVIPLTDNGLGFLVADVPPAELTETLDHEMLGLVSSLWWQLAACSEITAAPAEVVLDYLKDSSILSRALASHDADLLFSNIWTLDPGQVGCMLWQQLNPDDWQLLLQMMETYRVLKRYAFDAGRELWGAREDSR